MKIHEKNGSYLIIESSKEDVAVFFPLKQLKNWKDLGGGHLSGPFHYYYEVRTKHGIDWDVGIPLVFNYKGKQSFVNYLRKYKINEDETIKMYDYLKKYISKEATDEVLKTVEG
jgi:hypothetical protein